MNQLIAHSPTFPKKVFAACAIKATLCVVGLGDAWMTGPNLIFWLCHSLSPPDSFHTWETDGGTS